MKARRHWIRGLPPYDISLYILSEADVTNHSELNLSLTDWKLENIENNRNKAEMQDKENSNFWHRAGNVELPENRVITNKVFF